MVYNLNGIGWDKPAPPPLGSGIWIQGNSNTLLTNNNSDLIGADIIGPINGIALRLYVSLFPSPTNKNFVGIRNNYELNLVTTSNLPSTLVGMSRASYSGSGVEGAGILNNGSIRTGNQSDSIRGSSYIPEASGISNHGTIETGDGIDYVHGFVYAGGTRFGIENDGIINTGGLNPSTDKDDIMGYGVNNVGGILNRGTILTGVGSDTINAYANVATTSNSDGPINQWC